MAIYDRLPAVWVQTTQGEKMPRHKGPRRAFLAAFAMALFAAVTVSAAGAARGNDQISKINHIVVIYEENHSFDNLYGGWEGVNGLANADAAHTAQVDQSGAQYSCLLQLDVNLTVPPLTKVCDGTTPRGVNVQQPLPREYLVHDRQLHRAGRDHVSKAEGLLRIPERDPATVPALALPAAARATWCTSSTRSSTS